MKRIIVGLVIAVASLALVTGFMTRQPTIAQNEPVECPLISEECILPEEFCEAIKAFSNYEDIKENFNVLDDPMLHQYAKKLVNRCPLFRSGDVYNDN